MGVPNSSRKAPDTPNKSEYRNWARMLSEMKNKSDPEESYKIWRKLKKAPPLFRDNALLFHLNNLKKEKKKKFLLNNHQVCRRLLRQEIKNQEFFKEYLLEKKYLLETRLRIAEKCANSASSMKKVIIYKYLWQFLPAYRKGVDYLKTVLQELQNLEQKKLLQMFKGYMFDYHPEALSQSDRKEAIGELPCSKREIQIKRLLTRGVYNLIPEYFEGCSLPYMEARFHYYRGNYAKARNFLQKTEKGEWLKKRLKNQLVLPEKVAEDHFRDWQKTKDVRHLIRAVKTWFTGGHYQKIYKNLEKIRPQYPYLQWSYGYSALMLGKKEKGYEILKKIKNTASRKSKEKSNYWLLKNRSFKLPSDFKRQPIKAFYYNQMLIYYFGDLKDRESKFYLPVLRIERPLQSGDFKNLYEIFANNLIVLPALALYEQGLKDQASPLFYRYFASNSRRRRYNKYRLWECWHLAEGKPLNCDRFYQRQTTPNLFPADLQSIIALDLNWPHLSPNWGDHLPLPWEKIVRREAQAQNLPLPLLYAVMFSESFFEPNIISSASAIGLFQVIPPTGKEVADLLNRSDFLVSELLEPEISIKFGAAYLAKLARLFNNNWPLVIAGYNAGPHQVKRWIKNRKTFALDSWIEEIPFNETRHYVKRVLGRWVLYSRELGLPYPLYPKHLHPISSSAKNPTSN